MFTVEVIIAVVVGFLIISVEKTISPSIWDEHFIFSQDAHRHPTWIPNATSVWGQRTEGDSMIFGYYWTKHKQADTEFYWAPHEVLVPRNTVEIVYPPHETNITYMVLNEYDGFGRPRLVSGGIGKDHVKIEVKRAKHENYRITFRIFGLYLYEDMTVPYKGWDRPRISHRLWKELMTDSKEDDY